MTPSCLLLVITILTFLSSAEGKNTDKFFLTKCQCTNGPRGKPDCDFSKLNKARLRKLVERLMGSQIVCVEAEGYVIPTFTSSLNPLSTVTGLSDLGNIQLNGFVDKNGNVVQTDPITISTAPTITGSEKKPAVSSKKKPAPAKAPPAASTKKSAPANKDYDDDDEDDDDKDDGDDDDDEKVKVKSKTPSKKSPGKASAGKTDSHTAASATAAITSTGAVAKPRLPPQFNSVPTSCTLDGFQCSTENGLELLFPTPILIQELVTDQQSFQMNEELKEIMLNLEEDDDGCKYNLHGGYRSQDGFLSRPDRSVQWLKRQIIPRIENLLKVSNASSLISFTVDGWGAVLRGGHGQNMHVHPGSMYAGVYYVTAPQEISTAAKGVSGGCLSFVDPRNGVGMAQVVRGKNIYGEAIEICPGGRGGLLVIFPSWLMHEVKPMPESYKGPRIGISFNAVYKP